MEKEKLVERLLFAASLFVTIFFPAALAQVFEDLTLLPCHLIRKPLFCLPPLKSLELSFQISFVI